MRCPGQDTRFWGSDSIFDVVCPYCDAKNEFFQDEPRRKCKNCGKTYRNPKLDMGCAQYCESRDLCLGKIDNGKDM